MGGVQLPLLYFLLSPLSSLFASRTASPVFGSAADATAEARVTRTNRMGEVVRVMGIIVCDSAAKRQVLVSSL